MNSKCFCVQNTALNSFDANSAPSASSTLFNNLSDILSDSQFIVFWAIQGPTEYFMGMGIYSECSIYNITVDLTSNLKGREIMNSDTKDIILDSVLFNHVKYTFTSPIKLTITKSEEYFTIDYDDLDIYVCELSINDALDNFAEQIDMLWHAYALEDNKKLSSDAIILKNKLYRLVKEVKAP